MPFYAEKIYDMCTLLKYAKNAAVFEVCGNRIKLICLVICHVNVLPVLWMTSYLDHMKACRSIPLQRVTSLRRRAQSIAPLMRRIGCAASDRWRRASAIVQGVPAVGGGACIAPLPCLVKSVFPSFATGCISVNISQTTTTPVLGYYCKKLNSLKHLVRTTVAELNN